MDGTTRGTTDVVIRPSLANRPGSQRLGEFVVQPWFAVASLLLSVVGVAAFRTDQAFPLMMVLLGLVGLGFFGFARLTYSNATLYVKGGRFGRTNFLGIRKEWSLADARALRMLAVRLGPTTEDASPKLIVLSGTGGSVCQVGAADYFSVSDLSRLAAAGRMELSGSWDDKVTSIELEADYPGSYSMPAKAFLFTSRRRGWQIFVGSAIAFAVIAVIIVLGFLGRH